MANNPNHLKNLKPFKKGIDERRNVTGLNAKIPELDELLATEVSDDGMREIIRALKKKAVKGDVRASEVILNRAYGQATQFINQKVMQETIIFKIEGQEIPFQSVKGI